MPDQVAALPADVGLCSCSARNSLRATRCHSCGSTLPWVKPKAEPKFKAPKIEGALSNNVNTGVDTEALTTFGIGCVVFVVSLMFPFVGLWLYRYFSSDESPLAGYAMAGGFAGLACWVWLGMGNAGHKPGDANSVSP